MKAPEKIWINQSDLPRLSGVIDKDSVQYIQADAFIEKACGYLRNHIDKDLTIYHEQTWCKHDEFVEKFCKYMKGK